MNEKLIKIGDKTYKEAKPIMLPARDEKNLYRGQIWTHNNGGTTKIHLWTNETTVVSAHELLGYCIPQHLYIVVSEQPKIGDWVIEYQKGDIIGTVQKISNEYEIAPDIQKKIIASTEPYLKINNPDYDIGKLAYINLPKPSSDFVKKYYELNGYIKDVLVELLSETKSKITGTVHYGKPVNSIKIAPDNTISIIKKQNNFKELYMKALKKLDTLSDEQLDNFVNFKSKQEEKKYTEQEVRTLMFRSYNLCSVDEIPRTTSEMNKWIDKELK